MARRSRIRKLDQEVHPNRLIGWLVSYEEDEFGSAHEIRLGRTLISAENGIQARCITIPNGELSSPHSAVNATAKHRVFIQDIFSEQGTYVTRSSKEESESVEGPVELRHGDWLKFGEGHRFQLCLIDRPNR